MQLQQQGRCPSLVGGDSRNAASTWTRRSLSTINTNTTTLRTARTAVSVPCRAASNGSTPTPPGKKSGPQARSATATTGTAADVAQLPLPEGTMGLPLIGETPEYLKQNIDFYLKRRQQHGNVFKSHVLFSPTAFVYGEDAIRDLLQQEHRLVESNWPDNIRALLGSGSLVTQQFAKHTQQRRIVAQAFTRDAVSSYTSTVVDSVDWHVRSWVEAGDVKGYLAAKDLTLDVAGAALVGWRFTRDELAVFRDRFMTYVGGFFGLPINLPWTNFGRAMAARKELLASIDVFVSAAMSARDAGLRSGGPGDDISGGSRPPANTLDVLLEAVDEQGRPATKEEIKDQVLTQLFAGHETTATAATVVLLELCRHPEVLRQLRAEQATLMQQYGNDMTPEVLDRMQYADRVVKEVIRYRPPVPLVWRKTLEDVEVHGRRIPKGWQVMLLVGRSTKEIPLWKETTDKFDPDRWLQLTAPPASATTSTAASPSPAAAKDPRGYLAFGDGARVCVGMRLALLELKALVACLARHAVWEPTDPDQLWMPMGPPAGGLPMRFEALPREELMSYAKQGVQEAPAR